MNDFAISDILRKVLARTAEQREQWELKIRDCNRASTWVQLNARAKKRVDLQMIQCLHSEYWLKTLECWPNTQSLHSIHMEHGAVFLLATTGRDLKATSSRSRPHFFAIGNSRWRKRPLWVKIVENQRVGCKTIYSSTHLSSRTAQSLACSTLLAPLESRAPLYIG